MIPARDTYLMMDLAMQISSSERLGLLFNFARRLGNFGIYRRIRLLFLLIVLLIPDYSSLEF